MTQSKAPTEDKAPSKPNPNTTTANNKPAIPPQFQRNRTPDVPNSGMQGRLIAPNKASFGAKRPGARGR